MDPRFEIRKTFADESAIKVGTDVRPLWNR